MNRNFAVQRKKNISEVREDWKRSLGEGKSATDLEKWEKKDHIAIYITAHWIKNSTGC